MQTFAHLSGTCSGTVQSRDGQNLISWRWSLVTDPVWWRSMHAISSYRRNRPTNTHTQTDRGDYEHTSQLSTQCNDMFIISRHRPTVRNMVAVHRLRFEWFQITDL